MYNLSGFDIVYILHFLLKSNRYKFHIFTRDDQIISITIINDKYSFKLVDFYLILNHSLDKLGESFGIIHRKTKFPYSFITKENLFYEGNYPSINYFSNRGNSLSLEEYNKLKTSNNNQFTRKKDTIEYLTNVLKCLAEIIYKFMRNLKDEHRNVDVRNCITISSVAMKIFRQKYYYNKISLITKEPEKDIRLSYYGEVTEVYKPYGENLYYYDVNSLYPFASLNDLPSLNCEYGRFKDEDINNLFGFCVT